MRFWRTPLDRQEFTRPRGRIYIIIERCKGCAFCVEYCPRDVLVISEKFNKKGYHYPEAVKEDACVDCNLCEIICPEFAIYSENANDADAAASGESAPGEPDRQARPKTAEEGTGAGAGSSHGTGDAPPKASRNPKEANRE